MGGLGWVMVVLGVWVGGRWVSELMGVHGLVGCPNSGTLDKLLQWPRLVSSFSTSIMLARIPPTEAFGSELGRFGGSWKLGGGDEASDFMFVSLLLSVTNRELAQRVVAGM